MNVVSFEERIKQAMSLRNITQVELCEKTQIPKSAMSQYVNGKITPKTDRLVILANALSVTPAWLMGLDVDMEKDIVINRKDLVQHTAGTGKSHLISYYSRMLNANDTDFKALKDEVSKLDISKLEILSAYINYLITEKKQES